MLSSVSGSLYSRSAASSSQSGEFCTAAASFEAPGEAVCCGFETVCASSLRIVGAAGHCPSASLSDGEQAWGRVGSSGGRTCTDWGSVSIADDGPVLPCRASLTVRISHQLRTAFGMPLEDDLGRLHVSSAIACFQQRHSWRQWSRGGILKSVGRNSVVRYSNLLGDVAGFIAGDVRSCGACI